MVAEADVYLFHRASGDNFGRRPGCIHSEHSRNIFTFFPFNYKTLRQPSILIKFNPRFKHSFLFFFVFISFYCSTVYKNRHRTKKSKHSITSTAFCLLEQPHAQLQHHTNHPSMSMCSKERSTHAFFFTLSPSFVLESRNNTKYRKKQKNKEEREWRKKNSKNCAHPMMKQTKVQKNEHNNDNRM